LAIGVNGTWVAQPGLVKTRTNVKAGKALSDIDQGIKVAVDL
jgi:malate synthase